MLTEKTTPEFVMATEKTASEIEINMATEETSLLNICKDKGMARVKSDRHYLGQLANGDTRSKENVLKKFLTYMEDPTDNQVKPVAPAPWFPCGVSAADDN